MEDEMKTAKTNFIMCLQILLAGMLFGCATNSRHYSSSVMDYLYPGKKEYFEEPGNPVLSLPLRAGIVFIPDSGHHHLASELQK